MMVQSSASFSVTLVARPQAELQHDLWAGALTTADRMAPKAKQPSCAQPASPLRPSQIVNETSAVSTCGQHIEVTLERVSTGGTKHQAKFTRAASGAMSGAERAQKKRVRATLFPQQLATSRRTDSDRKRAAAVARLLAVDDLTTQSPPPLQPPQLLQQSVLYPHQYLPPPQPPQPMPQQPPMPSLPPMQPSPPLEAAERAKKLHAEAQQRLRERKRQLGPAYERCWTKLCESERAAAIAFGFNSSSWDCRASGDCRPFGDAWDGKEECDEECDEGCAGHTPDEEPVPAWLLPWDALSTTFREAAANLGYSKRRWDKEENALAGAVRFQLDDYREESRIRQDESGNWYTEIYLEFRQQRWQDPDLRFRDFLEREYCTSLEEWQMHTCDIDKKVCHPDACPYNHKWGGVCMCGKKIRMIDC